MTTTIERQAAAASAKFLRAMSKDPMIRAADDLLTALRDMTTPHHPDGQIDNCPECLAMRKRARAAVAIAEGQ